VSETKVAQSRQSGRFVVHSPDGWAVKCTATGRSSSLHSTLAEAIKAAEEAIAATGGELKIHSPDSRTRSAYVVGREPFQKVSAVEGIAPTSAAKARAQRFTQSKLSSEERLQAIIEAYQPDKG
jgi:hypothetical protein